MTIPDFAYGSDVVVDKQEVVTLQLPICTSDSCAEILYICENFADNAEDCLVRQHKEICIPCLKH